LIFWKRIKTISRIRTSQQPSGFTQFNAPDITAFLLPLRPTNTLFFVTLHGASSGRHTQEFVKSGVLAHN